VGRDQRLFAAHEDVLTRSSFFAAALKDHWFDDGSKKVDLPDEYENISFSLVHEI